MLLFKAGVFLSLRKSASPILKCSLYRLKTNVILCIVLLESTKYQYSEIYRVYMNYENNKY